MPVCRVSNSDRPHPLLAALWGVCLVYSTGCARVIAERLPAGQSLINMMGRLSDEVEWVLVLASLLPPMIFGCLTGWRVSCFVKQLVNSRHRGSVVLCFGALFFPLACAIVANSLAFRFSQDLFLPRLGGFALISLVLTALTVREYRATPCHGDHPRGSSQSTSDIRSTTITGQT